VKLQLIKNAVTSGTARQVLLVKKNSPALLFGAGVVGLGTTVVLACKATLQLESVSDGAEKKRVQIDSGSASYKLAMKDTHILRIQTTLQIAKLYAPAVTAGVLTIGAFTGAHVVLTKRNTALMAAYAALDKGFKEYQQRVRDAVGADEERKIRMDGQRGNYVTEDEKGNKTKVPVTRSRLQGDFSIYARMWDEHSARGSWNPQPEYNLAFLKSQQNYMNDRLQAKGHLFLNEVYDALGLERTKEGAVVGWVKGMGDNFVDFNIFQGEDPTAVLDFISGEEGGIWLDFNVDGVIYNLI